MLSCSELPCRNVIASEASRWDAEPKSVFGVGAGRPIAMSFVAGSLWRGIGGGGTNRTKYRFSDCETAYGSSCRKASSFPHSDPRSRLPIATLAWAIDLSVALLLGK